MSSDEDLMQAYVGGDQRAFDALYRRYRPVLLGVTRRYVAAPADVEDLVQLTFLKLHRARATYRAGTPLRPWLFMIARNTRRDFLRARLRKAQGTADVEAVPVIDDPSERLERAEQLAQLYGALRNLSGTLRRTLEQHWLDDLAFEEIARIDGILSGTARVRAHRACAQLRACFAA